MISPLVVETHGKWILAGEHSVLRGSPALVFPLKSKKLSISYGPGPGDAPKFLGERGAEYEVLFRAVFEKCCEDLELNSREILNKQILISSTLPVGTGLGASAAFCVAMTKLFQNLGYIPDSQVYATALKFENLFHGESSGVDIAVCLSDQGLIFERQGGRRELFMPTWRPHLYVSYAGQRGMTFDCVSKVKRLIEENPEVGHGADEKMRQSVMMCIESLQNKTLDSKNRISLLSDGIRMAAECFESWDLTGGGLRAEMDKLMLDGALAVKPTGSGGGGYVLSLWEKEPPLRPGLSPCFS